jgi:hypothetical protein
MTPIFAMPQTLIRQIHSPIGWNKTWQLWGVIEGGADEDEAREEEEAIIAFRDAPWRGDPEAEARYLEGLKWAAGPSRVDVVCGRQRPDASLASDFFEGPPQEGHKHDGEAHTLEH